MTSIAVFVLSVFGFLATLNALVRAGTVLPQVSVIPERALAAQPDGRGVTFSVTARSTAARF